MIVRTSKLIDREILDIARRLLGAFPEGSARLSLAMGVIREISSVDDVDDYEFDVGSRNIESMAFRFGNNIHEQVLFQRGIIDKDYWNQYPNITGFSGKRQPSAHFDELAFLPPHSTPQGPRGTLADSAKIFVSELISDYASAIDAGSDEEAKNLSRVVSKQLNDLRKLNLEMTRGLAEARQRDEESFSVRQAELDRSFKERLAQLTEKEAELEKRRQELNDREPQHERRRESPQRAGCVPAVPTPAALRHSRT